VTKPVLLITADLESAWNRAFREALRESAQVETCLAQAAAARLQEKEYELAVIDASEISDVPALIALLHGLRPNLLISVATWSPTWQRARRALRAGAKDYVRKSLDQQMIRHTFEKYLIGAP